MKPTELGEPPPLQPPPSALGHSHHVMVLVLSLLAVLGSVLLQLRPDGRATLPGLSGQALPGVCPSWEVGGFRCPGCGLTRSFVRFTAGDWAGSFRMHRLGPILAGLTFLQLPYRLWALARPPERPPLGPVLPTVLGWSLFAAFVASWLWDLFAGRLAIAPGP